MLPLFRIPLSVTLRHGGNLTILPLPSSVQNFIPILCNLKLQWEPQFYQYHSMKRPGIAKTPIPRIDYTVNQNVARLNWMITEFSREGRIPEARRLFDEMPDPDVITWTTMISGYIKCGMIREARNLFDRVDAKKNVVTWTAMVSAYIKKNQILKAEKLFHEMPHKNTVSWNTMIDGYVRNGRMDSALSLFEEMPERNVVSGNMILTGLAQSGRIEEAWRIFDQMPERNIISWTAMITGLSKNGRIMEAQMLFDRMPEQNVVSWNAMIAGYAQNLMLDKAFNLFKRMPERDLPSWNAMITGFIQNGDLQKAQKLFSEMPSKNVISWTTMMTGYVQDGQSEVALRIFSKMQLSTGVKPNQGTFVTVLGACSNLAGLGEGQQIHQIICKSVYQGSAFVVSALINMYSKCGELGTARKMFDDGLTSQRDLVSWNGMIAAYAHHGCGKEAIHLFKEMQGLGFKPNYVTYVGLLSACSHAGFVEEGLKYFDELVRDSSIQVREDHYACLVDLYGRAGRLEEAFKFIERLPTKSSACVWGALLAGCNVHGVENIGKLAAKKLTEVEPENAGTYLLLSNIYASNGKWREAAEVRLKMKDKGLKKQPGCSWIEVGNRVHLFVVGDKSHCQSKTIYLLLCDLHVKMKKVGYVPNDDFMVDE
ncbi:pentatricopeptide repeat-containing protein At2g35030, mitochondrial-like [Cornus florida]|uniref:pentatricopeptide repeat-containing protein At2g35030, mitochondrial-like n=1 Tax=Cornus florida TaxID=4283 RepID=UPI0028A2C6CD|nr:pentatricopeptide repeat-containing protein At2g35030, mitochondrial-like [Cornus florida]